MNSTIYICPACQGDGKETCNNPDHGFLIGMNGSGMMSTNESSCPCCGHDENHKVYYRENGQRLQRDCYECNGTGGMTLEDFDNYCDMSGYDNEPELKTN
jgi:hypothetical protein